MTSGTRTAGLREAGAQTDGGRTAGAQTDGGRMDGAQTDGARTDGAELLRALGSVPASPPPHCQAVFAALGLPAPTAAEHTAVFVLSAPPHAAIHLGGEGKLGGEGLDRVAGFWRVIGLNPPPDADQLGVLLMLYAELADAEAAARSEVTRGRLRHARLVLIREHLWSWAPGYLTAVRRIAGPALAGWAELTLHALHLAACSAPTRTAALPAALRDAPAPVDPGASRDKLLDALVAPVRSGILLTREDLRAAAAAAGLGYRVGERRYTLAAMLDQDAGGALGWLSGHADMWAESHAGQLPVGGHDPRHWWSRRAAGTARTLRACQPTAL
jgi:nitrate reductase delta subunit